MNDQILTMISFMLKLLEQMPFIGKWVCLLCGAGMGLSALCSAFVILWHGVAIFVKAIGMLARSKAIEDFGDSLCADEAKINNFEQSWILPILNRLSIPPLPKAARPSNLKVHTQGDV